MTRLLVVTLALLLACTRLPEESAALEVPPPEPVVPYVALADAKPLRFGLIPYLAPATVRQAHQLLAAHLSEAIGTPVELVVADGYGDAIDRMVKGEFDVIELSPYAFAIAERRVKLRCLVQSISNGSSTTTGYILVRADSDIRDIEALKGVQFGFVDPLSTAGYLFAAKALRDRGIDPKKDFSTVDFFGNHEAVLLALYYGRIDAAASYQVALRALKSSKGIDPLSFRVIAKTPRMPNDVFCTRADLPKDLTDVLSRTLLGLNGNSQTGRQITGALGLNGYLPFEDAAYASVRHLAGEVGPP